MDLLTPQDVAPSKPGAGGVAMPRTQPRPGALCPSASDLLRALALLDMNKDGKVWEEDLDALLDLHCACPTPSASAPLQCAGVAAAGAEEEEEEWRRRWGEFKALCRTEDGLLSVEVLQRAIELGLLQAEMGKRPLPWHAAPLGAGAAAPREGRQGQGQGLARTLRSSSAPWAGRVCELLEKFNSFDCDHNGVICARDLRHALLSLTGVEFSRDECKDLIRRVDHNLNGVVELREFPSLLHLLVLG